MNRRVMNPRESAALARILTIARRAVHDTDGFPTDRQDDAAIAVLECLLDVVERREKERLEFEDFYRPLGIVFTRSPAGSIAPEPWGEYEATDAGYLWAGWLAGRGVE